METWQQCKRGVHTYGKAVRDCESGRNSRVVHEVLEVPGHHHGNFHKLVDQVVREVDVVSDTARHTRDVREESIHTVLVPANIETDQFKGRKMAAEDVLHARSTGSKGLVAQHDSEPEIPSGTSALHGIKIREKSCPHQTKSDAPSKGHDEVVLLLLHHVEENLDRLLTVVLVVSRVVQVVRLVYQQDASERFLDHFLRDVRKCRGGQAYRFANSI